VYGWNKGPSGCNIKQRCLAASSPPVSREAPHARSHGFRFSIHRAACAPGQTVRRGEPRRILVLGDYSGRAQRGLVEIGRAIAGRTLPAVDIDNFEELLGRVAPQVSVRRLAPSLTPLAALMGDLAIGFTQLDDFHPDSLYERTEVFQELRRLRNRLLNPAAFAQAAAELEIAVPQTPQAPAAQPPAPAADEGLSIEGLLDATPAEALRATDTPEAAIARMIGQIVAPLRAAQRRSAAQGLRGGC